MAKEDVLEERDGELRLLPPGRFLEGQERDPTMRDALYALSVGALVSLAERSVALTVGTFKSQLTAVEAGQAEGGTHAWLAIQMMHAAGSADAVRPKDGPLLAQPFAREIQQTSWAQGLSLSETLAVRALARLLLQRFEAPF